MKKMILVILIIVGVSQAKALHCTLNKENANVVGQFDQQLFGNLEVLKNGLKQQLILVKSDGSIDENYDFRTITKPEDLAKIDKSIFVVVSRNDDKIIAIGIGGVDVSQTQNVTPMHAIAVGDIGKFLSVIDYSNKLSLTCFQF